MADWIGVDVGKYGMTCDWCGVGYSITSLRYANVERPACAGCKRLRKAWVERERYEAKGRTHTYVEHACEGCGLLRQMRADSPSRLCMSCNQARGAAAHVAAAPVRAAARQQLVHVGPPTWVDLPPRHPAMRPQPKRTDWWQYFVQGACSWCGEQFLAKAAPGPSQPEYCSTKCQREASKYRRGRFIVPMKRRRAIYERDGWVCQLCSEPVLDGLPASDIWAATLDHIIPRSRGGEDTDDNLRLAHRWCNSVRGDETYYTAADLAA